MHELNGDWGETPTVSQGLTFERLPPANLGAKPAPEAMRKEMPIATYLREIGNAHCGDLSTDEYCMELLRQATFQDNPEIWEIVQRSLGETVREWIKLHPSRAAAASLDSEENYIARAFAKLYEASVCKQVQFSSLSDMLKYLQVSLNCVILDSLRTYLRPQEIDQPQSYDTGESAAVQSENKEVWEILSKSFADAREKRIAYLLFHCGLRPNDIVQMFPEEFRDVHEISLLRCSIIKRFINQKNQHA
jgi:hypothetical protein